MFTPLTSIKGRFQKAYSLSNSKIFTLTQYFEFELNIMRLNLI